MDISSSASVSQGQALLAASLAKKQQTQNGQATLELIQSAVQPQAAPTSASAALGSKIDIRV